MNNTFCILCEQLLEKEYSHPVWIGKEDYEFEYCNGPYAYAPIPEPLTDAEWDIVFGDCVEFA